MKKFLLIGNICLLSAAITSHACDQSDRNTVQEKLLYPLEPHEKSPKVRTVISNALRQGSPAVSRWTDCFIRTMPIENGNLSIVVAGRQDKKRDPSLLVFIAGPKTGSWFSRRPVLSNKAVMVATTYRWKDKQDYGLLNCAGEYLRKEGYSISSTAGRTETDASLKNFGFTTPMNQNERTLISHTVSKLFDQK